MAQKENLVEKITVFNGGFKDWNKFDQWLKRDLPEFDVFSQLDHPI